MKEDGFKDYRYTAAKVVERLGYIPVRNPEDLGVTQSAFEATLRNDNPIFVLLIGTSDSNVVKRECAIALERGLHIIAFLKTNESFISDSTKKIMREISERIFDYDCSCFNTCEELDISLTARILEYQSRIMQFRAEFRPEKNHVYEIGTEMIKSAKKRIILCQETSSMILGPREGNFVEKDFYQALLEWIISSRFEMEFIHIYSQSKTNKALQSAEYNLINAKRELKLLLSQKNGCQISFRRYTSQKNLAHIIADTNLLLSFFIDNTRHNIFLPHFIVSTNTSKTLISESKGIGTSVSIGSRNWKIDEFYNV